LETITVFSRTLRRAGIPIKYSEGFHPLPRIISGSALPVGIESICESIDFVVSGDMSPFTFLKKMNRELPSGLKLLEAEEVPLKFSPVSDIIHNVNYLISLASSDSSSVRLLEQLKGAPESKGKGVGEGKKPLSALEIGVLDSTFLSVRMEERMGLSKTLQGFFHIDPNGLRGMRVLKTQFIKGN
jgi:hypothetical protein